MISAHLTMVDNVPWSTLIQRPWSDTIGNEKQWYHGHPVAGVNKAE